MILGHYDLINAFKTDWKIFKDNKHVPPQKLHIGSNSIDVSLTGKYIHLESEYHTIDPEKTKIETIETINDEYHLLPGEFVLTNVRERFNCTQMYMSNYYAQMIEGRSTLARLGIAIHLTAGFGDYGFEGSFTLELFNHSKNTIILRPGMRVAQVYFIQISNPKTYKGAYMSEDHFIKPVQPKLGEGRF